KPDFQFQRNLQNTAHNRKHPCYSTLVRCLPPSRPAPLQKQHPEQLVALANCRKNKHPATQKLICLQRRFLGQTNGSTGFNSLPNSTSSAHKKHPPPIKHT